VEKSYDIFATTTLAKVIPVSLSISKRVPQQAVAQASSDLLPILNVFIQTHCFFCNCHGGCVPGQPHIYGVFRYPDHALLTLTGEGDGKSLDHHWFVVEGRMMSL